MIDTAAERLALVGATSQLGRELKEQLADAGYPADRVQLLDMEDEVGLLTDYGDEAAVVLNAARETVSRFALACFCGSAEVTRRLAPAVVEEGGLAVDCTGAFAGEQRARLAGATPAPEPGIVVVPHPGTLLLAGLANALDLSRAAATVLLPASEKESPGTDDLARQTTTLLNLGEIGDADEGVFGRRVAFDLWPDPGEAGDRMTAELAALEVAAPRLFVLRAPVFHALSTAVWLPGRDRDGVVAALGDAGVPVDARDHRSRNVDSPARAAGRAGVHVAAVRADADGVWLWAVQDNYHAVAAAALRVIAAYLEPPPGEPAD